MRTNRTVWAVALLLICQVGTSSALEITTTNLPTGMEMVPYSTMLNATNGTPPYRWGIYLGVVAWGSPSNVPVGLSNAVAIVAAGDRNLALKSDGTVVAWLGVDLATNVPSGLSNVVEISAGNFHNLALKSDGKVVA